MQGRGWWALLILFLLVACGQEESPSPPALATPLPPTVTLPSMTPTLPSPSATPSLSPTALPSATALPTDTPLPSATPDPFAGLSIPSLRQEQYGQEGAIELLEQMELQPAFTRYRIRFPSDGLWVEGFMNVPVGPAPFPVVIVNHGYMPPQSYQTLTYTTKYADALARAGFLTIHPNFRNHRGSDEGPNPFRIGYARDVLHLIPMAQRLPQADGGKVGLWGHSMGGGVTLRVLTISDQVGAALLYGSMSGDEAKNYEAIMRWSNGEAARNGSLPNSPQEAALYAAISPLNYLAYVGAPLAIHHGVRDEQVPYAWSEELAARLDEVGRPYEFYAYPQQRHNFSGGDYDLFLQRTIDFFQQHLGAGR